MTVKLIKVGSHYDLYHRIAEEDLIIGFASTDNTFEKKLSFKNCQAIEQQFPTERMWDVEIVEEPADLAFYESGNRFPIDANLPDRFKYKPKLDADGCLILKTI